MIRVVVDTNVLVSAFIAHGKPGELVIRLLEEHKIILSRPLLAELTEVLAREKFHVRKAEVEGFLANLRKESKFVSSTSHFRVILEDPDDDIIINTAYKGKAEYIVTGDRHLLALKNFKGIEIVSVAQMFCILNNHE